MRASLIDCVYNNGNDYFGTTTGTVERSLNTSVTTVCLCGWTVWWVCARLSGWTACLRVWTCLDCMSVCLTRLYHWRVCARLSGWTACFLRVWTVWLDCLFACLDCLVGLPVCVSGLYVCVYCLCTGCGWVSLVGWLVSSVTNQPSVKNLGSRSNGHGGFDGVV